MSVNNFYRKYNSSNNINISKEIDKEIDKNYQSLYHKYKKKYFNLKQKGSALLLKEEDKLSQEAAEQPVSERKRPQLFRQSSLIDIDKNNIQDSLNHLDDNCFKIDGTILFGKENFKNVNIIKSGSYGTVTIYESDKGNKIAIKTFEKLIDYCKEKFISKIIAEKQKKLSNILQIVPSYWYENGEDRKIIMHGKDGDLEKIAGEISSDLKENFTEAKSYFIDTVESIKKLWGHGLYFCDLKLGNVLYSEKLGKKIYLADIGGVVYFKEKVSMDFFKSNIGFDLIIFDKYFGFVNKTNKKTYFFGIVDKSNWHENIEPDSNILEKERNGKTYYIITNNVDLNGSITLSSTEGVFTYPLTEGGIVKLINEDQNQMELELLNNIFYSIIVFLFNLLFNNFFNFDHISSKKKPNYIENSVIEVNKMIDESELIGLQNLKKLTKYLFEQSLDRNAFLDLNREIVVMNDENIEKKFDDIILLVENINLNE